MRRETMREFPPLVGPVPIAVYATMFGATAAGQLVGMIVDAIAIGRRVLWVPLLCSVALEAVVGARFGAARIGRPLTSGECARLSAYYSTGLGMITLPLAVWTLASNPALARGVSGRDVILAIGIALLVLAAATVLRQLLMTLVSRGRS